MFTINEEGLLCIFLPKADLTSYQRVLFGISEVWVCVGLSEVSFSPSVLALVRIISVHGWLSYSFSFTDWCTDLKNAGSPLFMCMTGFKNGCCKWNLLVWDKGQWFSPQETGKCH